MYINLENIRKLTYGPEGMDVEFKETTGQLNRGMETLCGMINGRGGIVIFGINNNGKIIGQEVSDKTTREIGEALRKFDPAIDIQPHYEPLPDTDKFLIVFQSNGLEHDKPYLWDGRAYQRYDSVTSVMPREKSIRLYELTHGLEYKWETVINPQLKLSMLDEGLINNIIHSAVRRGRLTQDALNDSIPTALRRLELMKGDSLCNSAAVLFGKQIKDYPQFKMRLARFVGINKDEFFDNQQMFGNIFEVQAYAMAFFFKHLSLRSSTLGRSVRKDELEVPYDALREGVCNALCHRAWQHRASTIGIAIYDDRIEIENAGHFPESFSPSNIMNDEIKNEVNTSLPPNPIIANVMYLGGLIENWGRGLSMMGKECKRVGLPKPEFHDDGSFVKTVFRRPNTGLLDTPSSEKDTLNLKKDIPNPEKDTSKTEKDTPNSEKDTSKTEKDTPNSEKDTSKTEKDTPNSEKDTSKTEKDTPNSEKDKSKTGKDTPNPEKDTQDWNNDKLVGPQSDHSRTTVEPQSDHSRTTVGLQSDYSRITVGLKSVQTLVMVLGEDWYSSKDLREILGFKSRQSFHKNYISPSLKEGIIAMENPNYPNSSNQRYGLTLKGKAIYYELKRKS